MWAARNRARNLVAENQNREPRCGLNLVAEIQQREPRRRKSAGSLKCATVTYSQDKYVVPAVLVPVLDTALDP